MHINYRYITWKVALPEFNYEGILRMRKYKFFLNEIILIY